MAIMTELLETSGVRQVVEEGRNSFNNLMSFKNFENMDAVITNTINQLSNAIDTLNKKEAEFLKAFNCDSQNNFKQKLNNYYQNKNLVNFTASSLANIVEDFRGASDEAIREKMELVEQMIHNLIESDLVNDWEGGKKDLQRAFSNQEVTEEIRTYVANKLISLLSARSNTIKLGGGGILTSIRFAQTYTTPDDNQILRIAANSLTGAFDQHLSDLQRIANANLNKYKNDPAAQEIIKNARLLLKSTKSQKENGSGSMNLTLGVEWARLIRENTVGHTGKGSDINISKKKIQEINNRIRDRIIAELHLKSNEIENYARRRIDEMLVVNDKMFFIGSSTTQLEGILGEINAILALTNLLGDNYQSGIIEWVASSKAGGKQPSIDIVIKEIAGITDGVQYGVQVKNTTMNINNEMAHYIGFADKSIDEIFETVGIDSEDIKNVYISNAFNVPYKKRGRKYVQTTENTGWRGGAPEGFTEFIEVYKDLKSLTADINLYIAQFAPNFLYMGLGEDFKSTLATLNESLNQVGGNYLYIVGPKAFFASEMLGNLQEEIRALKNLQDRNVQLSFKLEAYFQRQKGEKESFNIVKVMNSTTDSEKQKKILTKDTHIKKIKSSWGFRG